ncbi:putative serine protease PepD [Nocardioides daedukensis]|uniref:Putative serine protease PepD n=1 Tax=Nocardioides daedukensis TaxID=634462 RepID=A0A7Y9UQG2_9ACTN|nr:trypsin-like peptidase domain-containing protein [Nocardioides daedukensis]NYG59232.1 putative serine protease PepD [Nocardioides daedukensis]
MSDQHPAEKPNPSTNVRGNPGNPGGQPGGQPWGPPPSPQQAPQQWGHQAPQQAPHNPAQQWGPPAQQPPQQQWAAPTPGGPDRPASAKRKGGKRGPGGLGFGIGLLVGALVLGLGGGFLGGKLSDEGGGGGKVDAGQVDISGLNLQDLVSVQSVADRALPAVVKIEAINARTGSTGSGVVLSKDGEILTNYHVIHAAAQGGNLEVYFNDGTTRKATIIGADPSTDIALIKAENVDDLATLKFGSAKDIKVGQAVVAVGSPYGLDSTVTAGIISTLNRPVAVPGMDDPNKPMIYPAVQTDAAINPGNSGGALINIKGELVGMNSANKLAASSDEYSRADLGSIGIGWAIPVDVIEPIVEQLRKGGEAKHAWLGIVPDDAKRAGVAQGALVDDFTTGSPSEAAGVQKGDVVVGIDDRPVAEGLALITTVLHYQPGDEVTLKILRSGESKEIKVKLGEQGNLIEGLS